MSRDLEKTNNACGTTKGTRITHPDGKYFEYTSESFRCFDFDCTSITGTGSTLSPTGTAYNQVAKSCSRQWLITHSARACCGGISS